MKIPIHYKITLVFGIIIAVILFGIYFYLNNSLREHTYQRIKTNLLRQVCLTRSFLEQGFIEDIQPQEFDAIADKIGKNLSLRVTIIGLDGTVIGDSELDDEELLGVENHLYRPEVQEALGSGIGESRRFSTTIKKDMFYIATGYGKGETQGIVRLSMPLVEIGLISNRLKTTLVISLFVAFILALISSFLVSVFISRPVRQISIVAQAIAKGDFLRKITIASNDEIGDLAKAFNYMSEQIRLRVEQVTASKLRLEAVLLSMFEGVMVVDLNGTILLMNQSLSDFFHIKQEPTGKKPLEVIRNIEIQEIVEAVLKMRQGVKSREISVLLPEEKILLVHATPVVRSGRPESAVLVFHDITNLRRLEKIRRDFVANVSHELRTPVASIKGFAETLLEGALEDKKNARDFIKIIHADSDRLAKLIDDLLDLSKIESGKLQLALQPVALMPVVKRVVSGLSKHIEDKSIIISIDIPERMPEILVNEAGLARVLLNLIDNAIKYTQEKGMVTISAKDKDKFVQVDISDNGIGIPEKDLSRLFERFYRVDKAHSRELGGTGLGLSIVKHIIHAHNGEVSVRSTVGQGSVFTFTIPKA